MTDAQRDRLDDLICAACGAVLAGFYLWALLGPLPGCVHP
jgi:hypothetical protein